MVKNAPCNAGDTGLIPGLGRSHMKSESEDRAVVSDSVIPWDCSLLSSSVRGILQARILEKKKKNTGVGCRFLL